MAVRERGLYNHHLSDIRYADALPVGSIVGVYVDKASAQGDDHIALTSSSSNKVADNYPGYLYCVGQSLSINDYPLLYEAIQNTYGGTAPGSVDLDLWPNITGTFNLPDLRMKRLNGPDGIDGPGSLTPDNAAMTVGESGGVWYVTRARQLDEYTIGTVRVSGYDSVTGFISGDLGADPDVAGHTGLTEITIGPLQSRILSGPPPHSHLLLTSEQDLRTGGVANGDPVDGLASPNYNTNRAQISIWDPDGAQLGNQAEHSHYLSLGRPVTVGSNPMYSYDESGTYLDSTYTGGGSGVSDVFYHVGQTSALNLSINSGTTLERDGSNSTTSSSVNSINFASSAISGSEVGGFEAPSSSLLSTGSFGSKYISFGSDGTSLHDHCVLVRSFTVTLDASQGHDAIWIIGRAGNDSNGGERPNESSETLDAVWPNGTETAAILSSGRVGGSQQHSNLYGQWTRIVIPIPTQYQGNSSLQVTFRSEINGSPAGETLSGGDMQPRDSTGAQLSTPHPNAYDRYGIAGIGLTEIASSGNQGTYYNNSYDNVYGVFKINDGQVNSRGDAVSFQEQISISLTPAEAGITINEGVLTMNAGEQIEVTATIVPTKAVPTIQKYFRVKYLIKAF